MSAIYKAVETENVTEVERLINMSFKNSIEMIHKMSTFKKADLAAQINPIIDNLYMQCDTYGNLEYDKDDRINTEEFRHIMSKIKHCETILYWLYEVDVLIGDTELDRMIKEAEDRIAHSNETLRYRLKTGKDGKRHRVLVNTKEDLRMMYEEKEQRKINTNKILDMATELTKKYFTK